ncbi:MAG: DUF2958 domain-containing protein [Pseudolabrys sp.]
MFCPWGDATWLLAELDREDPDIARPLRPRHGVPRTRSVSLAEIEHVRGPRRLTIDRHLYFTADKPISAYAEGARRLQRINA